MKVTQYITIKKTNKNIDTLFALFDALEDTDVDASVGGLSDCPSFNEGIEIVLPNGTPLRIVVDDTDYKYKK